MTVRGRSSILNRLAAIATARCPLRAAVEPPAQSVSNVNPDLERRDVHFSGRVQGVGFRYTTRAIAGRHPVAGFVQNLTDGRVRLVVEGTPSNLDALVADVTAEMDRYIESTSVTVHPATGEFSAFEIRH